MASISHGTVTMTGSAVRVTGANLPIRAVLFTGDDGNSNAIFIGGTGVTQDSYGVILTAANDEAWIRFEGSRPGDLSDFYADGTSGEKLQYLAIEAL